METCMTLGMLADGQAERLAEAGLDHAACRGLWARHLARRGNEGQALWAVLMLLAWLDHLPAGDV
jgi:hypothetical protein